MRRFNPDKELKKMQQGNKNKIIFGVIALLLVISIGSTYAVYQVRYSKRIIYTKVSPFSNKDLILSVFVDGKKVDKLPDKNDGYFFDGMECESETYVYKTYWDYDEWYLSIPSITIPNKCNINFSKTQSLLDKLGTLSRRNTSDLIYDETVDHNLRYIGRAPNNYIWFNCNDYNFINPEKGDSYSTQATAKECEKWRIIGTLNNVTIIDGKEDTSNPTKKSLVKIMRDGGITNMPFDNKNISTGAETDNGSSDWTKAELMYLLNPNNDSHELNGTLANNSLYWNAESGSCSNGQNNAVGACDFTNTGLKNQETQEFIQKARWYLGGINGIGAYDNEHGNVYAKDIYIRERGLDGTFNNCVTTGNCQERKNYCDGTIALIYASDYINATSGTGNTNGRVSCLNSLAQTWMAEKAYASCGQNDWIQYLSGSNNYWSPWIPTLTASPYPDFIFHISRGFPYCGTLAYNSVFNIIPSLYLKPSIKTIGGTGTGNDPYVIIP